MITYMSELPPELKKLVSQGRAQFIAVSSSQYDQITEPYIMIIKSMAQKISEMEKAPNRAQRRAQARKAKKDA